MEKQEIKSKWDDLAREIGAEVSPQAEKRAETHAAASEGGAMPAFVTPPAALPPPPKKPAADWAGLAGELGLPPLEEETPPTEKPVAKLSPPDEARQPQTRPPQSREPQSREPEQREQRSREVRPRGRQRGRRGDRRDDRREDGESRGPRRDQGRQRRDRKDDEREPSDHQRNRSDKRRDTHEPRREAPQSRDLETESVDEPVGEKRPVGEAPPPPPDREPLAKSPAVSLWHKIFGAPAEPVAKVADSPADDIPESSTRDESYESHEDFGANEIRSLSGEDVTAAGFIEETIEGRALTQDEGEPAERKRGQSRRRRRGGRGRKSGGGQREGRSAEPRVHESGGDDQLGADFDDLDDDEGDLSGDDSLVASRAVDGDSDLEDSDSEQASRHSRSMSAAQRAIPTWDDAIGFIVESNMQNRSQRRPSRSDSRGNSSRGRPRGRRN